MAHTLPQDHIKAIDQLRLRLSSLSTSIGLLLQDLQKTEPLLAWYIYIGPCLLSLFRDC